MTPEETIAAVRECIQTWASQQGHDRCWYYPDLFVQIAELVEAEVDYEQGLPTREEFEAGCRRFTGEEYEA